MFITHALTVAFKWLENEELATPPGFYIKYNDVRSGLYRTRMAASQKSRNVVESVTLWIQDIKAKGGKDFFLSDIDGLQPGNFITAWCTSFQLKVCFSEYAYRSVLDSTQPQSVSLLLCLFCRLWRKTQLLLAWIQPIKPSRACGQRKSMVVTRICPRICSLFL